MRIVLLGAPGSGKGTQAALMVERLGLPHISTGVLLRNAVKRGTALGLKARSIIDRGELVPDDIMSDMIEERLSRNDAADSFILDGYPRNLAQAKSLDSMLERFGQPVNEVIQIDVDPEQISRRLARRAKEQGRADDNAEVVHNRTRVYYEQTAPMIDYYTGRGLLTHVLGDGEVGEVLERILSVLNMNHTSA
ncbi:MAG: adenylate kinase [Gammaproteobacteria bacterium]|nr:MAG: adenylate kinase [Gammaproteobacteria bacterium]